MGRNAICEQQLQDPSVGSILFLDYDVVPPPGALLELIAMDKPVAAACVPIRVHGEMSWNVSPDMSLGYLKQLPTEPFQVQACGFGCVLVQRYVLESIGWPWFHTTYKPMGEDGQCIKTSEDEYFCARADGCGIEVWAHPGIRCKHFNTVDLSEVCHDLV